jgi:hypothetical protein
MSRGWQAHHGLAGGVERAGVGVGHAAAHGGFWRRRGFRRLADMVSIQIDVDAAGFQPFDLFDEGFDGFS